MNKTAIAIIGGLIGLGVVAGGAYLYKNSMEAPSLTPTSTPEKSFSGRGEIILEVTDAAVDMKTVSEVQVTLNRLEMYSNAKGWITLSSQPKTYNLLELKSSGDLALAARKDVDAEAYSKLRLTIGTVTIKEKGGAERSAKLPSGTFLVDTTIVVNDEKTSSVKIDFLADKSLHATANGDYVFAPVIRFESRSNVTATVDSRSMVRINGGSQSSDVTAGMNLDGEVKINFQLDSDLVIKLENGTLKIGIE